MRERWNTGPFEDLNGFQTVPVSWTINDRVKKAFFSRVAEIRGCPEKIGQA